MKRHLKSVFELSSNFITLIPPCQFVKYWQIFLELNLLVRFPRAQPGGCGVVRLWTLKMVYLVLTQYFFIQLQLINHFSIVTLTINQKGVSNKKV